MAFLVGTGELPRLKMQDASIFISKYWGGPLGHSSCEDSPSKSLRDIAKSKGLILLHGDAGKLHPEGLSWLEALGAWKEPVILLAIPSPNGDIPGTAASYCALTRYFSVPLLGIVQIGGVWDIKQRKIDGLPWCGCIKPEDSEDHYLNNGEGIVYSLRTRLRSLSELC